jgi:hypothetical protein
MAGKTNEQGGQQTNSGDDERTTGTINSREVEQMGWATNEQRGQQRCRDNDTAPFFFFYFFLS